MRRVPRGWFWTVTLVAVAVSAMAQVPNRPALPGSPAVSGQGTIEPDDLATAAARRPRRHLNQPLIELSAPEVDGALLSSIPAELLIGRRYLGDGALTFSLVEGPPGMGIDTRGGVLSWTPPASAEGTEVRVRVRATDGSYTAEIAFPLKVATSRTVSTSLQGSKLTVTANGSLQGLAFSFPSQVAPQPSQVGMASVGSADAPALPEGITRLTDFFRLTPVEAQGEGGIGVALPARLVPNGVPPQLLRLYVYTDEAEDTEGPAWLAISNELDVQPGGVVTLTLYAMGQLCFVGYETAACSLVVEPLRAPTGPTAIHVGPWNVNVGCQNLLLAAGASDPTAYVCTVTGDVLMTVTVRDFLPNPWKPAATIEELIGWLVAARQRFDTYGLSASPVFSVKLETPPKPSALGWVLGGTERRRVLHMTNLPKPKAEVQGTGVHEYLHHAQSRTRIAGTSSLIDQGGPGWWLTEGTARWFEDELYDDLDTYKSKELQPLEQVLWPGLAAAPSGTYGTRPYARFAFFKFAFNRCPGFNLPRIFNIDAVNDPVGLGGFSAALQDPGWGCDFGAGFGDANRATLQTALLEYTRLTAVRNTIAFLDPNESDFRFAGPEGHLVPSRECTIATACPSGSRLRGYRINPAGAKVFGITHVLGLGPGEKVRLEFERVSSTAPAPWVWIGEEAGGLDSGSWYELTQPISHLYGGLPGAPPLVVIIVNPSPTAMVPVNVRASIVTVVDESITFPERILTVGTCVTWTARVKTEPLAAAGLSAKVTLAPLAGNQVNLDITGKGVTLPNPFAVSGTFDAGPSSLTGTCINQDQARIRWTYSNKQIEHYEGSPPHMVTGPDFTFQRSAGALKWSDSVTVFYDRKIEWLNDKGEVTRTSFQAKAYEAVLYVIVDINSP